jgi:2-polyprenyl-3-methyl-5-hydroxy-6-metoxy-1,4-benzoquinol methylase
MNKKDIEKCYLCEGTQISVHAETVFKAPNLIVLKCSSCGLIFLSSHEHINEDYYQDSGMHQDDTDLFEIESWLKDTERDDERRYQFLKMSLMNKMVLDFGCGAGGFLLKAKNSAHVAEGIELESRLQPHFREHELSVFKNLDELRIAQKDSKKYDFLTLFHVLEHLKDPREILKELACFVKDDGEIIIEVPNGNDALITIFDCKPFSDLIYRSYHLTVWTAETLSKLALQAGLSVNYIKQVQRYPLSNHLYWLANGKPGGHEKWSFLDSEMLHTMYEKQLADIGRCDTIVASFSKGK